MDPKRVFSTQHWLHTCRLPKVKFFIKRAIGVVPNRYVGISFVHIWFLFAHRIVFSSRNIQTTGPIVPKKSAWSHWKKCICLFFRDITIDSFHQKTSNLLKVHFFTKKIKLLSFTLFEFLHRPKLFCRGWPHCIEENQSRNSSRRFTWTNYNATFEIGLNLFLFFLTQQKCSLLISEGNHKVFMHFLL